MFLSCIVYFSFVMITYYVGAMVVAVSEAPLEVGESSFRLEGGLSGKLL